MNISYKWLSEYINLSETPQQLAEILTSIGLEVEGIEEIESIKGGLKGILIGKVMECKPHPNSDHLNLTKVDAGTGELLQIVCGASNVATGQKVVVATVGTKLYANGQEFEIKEAKMRGEESFGMICAEDEIGIGTSHDGIMVLPDSAVVGTPAAEYFNVKSDYSIAIGLTPNRIDAASHIGVARDLAVYFSLIDSRKYKMPDISNFKPDAETNPIKIDIRDTDGSFRYSGLTIEGICVKESPQWLKNKLVSIGLHPINNVVDITNFVLFELGQPLHAFDLNQIKGNKVLVQTLPENTKFTTLDNIERTLNGKEIMICNAENEGMCMGGIFGGISSGITEKTTSIFIESAWFNPVRIRKSARLHGLSTDASFRYERGTDPNMVITALKRAALMVKEIAGGKITSPIIDVYTNQQNGQIVDFNLDKFESLSGKKIPSETVRTILNALEIEVQEKNALLWQLTVPSYRVDIQRQADVSEEILRIYGYNNIDASKHLNASIVNSPKINPETIQDKISNILAGAGYSEIMNNSITKSAYFESFEYFDSNKTVHILNPLSSDLNCLRQSLLFGMLETIQFNINHRQPNLKLFEFGKTYFLNDKNSSQDLKSYSEQYRLLISLTGNNADKNWNSGEIHTSFFDLKAIAENIFTRIGIRDLDMVSVENFENDLCREGLQMEYQKKKLCYIGILSRKVNKFFDLQNDIFYAELDLESMLKIQSQSKIEYSEISKYPYVRRDLALVVDKAVTFSQLKNIAMRNEKQILKNVGLFDVYEGNKIESDKKSYAMSFILQDENKTLEDKQIDKAMNKLIGAFEREFGAKLR